MEIEIQKDDKLLASNYDKHIEDASFFMAYNKKKKDLDNLLEEWGSRSARNRKFINKKTGGQPVFFIKCKVFLP